MLMVYCKKAMVHNSGTILSIVNHYKQNIENQLIITGVVYRVRLKYIVHFVYVEFSGTIMKWKAVHHESRHNNQEKIWSYPSI